MYNDIILKQYEYYKEEKKYKDQLLKNQEQRQKQLESKMNKMKR
ncbi:MAG: hypothetical protein ACOC33_00710 [bacterium]